MYETAVSEFAGDGYVVLSGVSSAAELDELQAQMEDLQRRATAGTA